MKFTYLLLLIFIALPTICLAELTDENLLYIMPDGYKIDFQTKQGNMIMTEMVPQAESVNDWTEMVTTQILLGMKNVTLEQFQDFMTISWSATCNGSEFASVIKGKENGYAFAVWIQTCPSNQSTGKPEYTWFKAIKGNDSFYVVQKAFKFIPSLEQADHAARFLKTIMVCDTRLADRPCPKLAQ